MKEVIMIEDDTKMMGLETIKDIVKDIKFKSYKSDDQEWDPQYKVRIQSELSKSLS